MHALDLVVETHKSQVGGGREYKIRINTKIRRY